MPCAEQYGYTLKSLSCVRPVPPLHMRNSKFPWLNFFKMNRRLLVKIIESLNHKILQPYSIGGQVSELILRWGWWWGYSARFKLQIHGFKLLACEIIYIPVSLVVKLWELGSWSEGLEPCSQPSCKDSVLYNIECLTMDHHSISVHANLPNTVIHS